MKVDYKHQSCFEGEAMRAGVKRSLRLARHIHPLSQDTRHAIHHRSFLVYWYHT